MGENEAHRVAGGRIQGVKANETVLTGGRKSDAAVDEYVLGSGTTLRLVCGDSAIELTAAGQINMTGKGFNIFVEGHGYINTRDGKLNLNDGTAAATAAPGAGHKKDIVSAVEALFDPQQKAQVKKSVQKPAGNAAPVSKPAAIQRVPPVSKKQPLENRLDRRVVKSIMKSEGIHHIQGGIPEAYGFRKGFGPAYE
ncbi:hypothetical protein [Erwinia oleae]|uniref:hypothetical protein n=1 Tax=Erwinia oleae TaxID=796334 RepID=UPI00126A64F8|nr:hypothetical protein [Erwinia oleae]